MGRFLGAYVWWGAALLLVVCGIAPIARPSLFADPIPGGIVSTVMARAALLALPAILVVLVLRRGGVRSRESLLVGLVCVIAAAYCAHPHRQFVDKGFYGDGRVINQAWQENLHAKVLSLDPKVIPHSYRMLPDGLIETFSWLTGSRLFGVTIYRLLFNALLFGFTFLFARLYLRRWSSLAVLATMVMLYPVTIAWYAGQPTDPLSHLTFVLCFFLLATGNDGGLAPTLVVGVLAKESVAIVSVARLFYGERRLRAAVLAAVYLLVSVAVIVAARIVVTSHFAYDRISGVTGVQIWYNLVGYDEWIPQYFFSIGVLIPGAALGFRLMDRSFRLLCVWTTSILIASSAIFSWLNEVRNLVPSMILLAIVNLRYVEARFFTTDDAGSDPVEGASA